MAKLHYCPYCRSSYSCIVENCTNPNIQFCDEHLGISFNHHGKFTLMEKSK